MNNATPFCRGRVKGVLATISPSNYSLGAVLESISVTEASGETLD